MVGGPSVVAQRLTARVGACSVGLSPRAFPFFEQKARMPHASKIESSAVAAWNGISN